MDDTEGWGVDRFFGVAEQLKLMKLYLVVVPRTCSPRGNNTEPVPMN